MQAKVDENEERNARAERVLNRRMWAILRQIIVNLAFGAVAFITAFTYNDPSAFNYMNSVTNMFVNTPQTTTCMSLPNVS
jgi:hypothetical protein